MKKSNMKKMLAAGISVALIAAISIMGTLAYLTAQQEQEVTNTFVAAGGGNIIDPDPSDPDPKVPADLDDGFFLAETPVKYENATYSLDTTAANYVLANNYEKVVPNTELPKDPFVKADIVTDVKAYVFVEVTNSLNKALTAEIDTDKWAPIAAGSNVYYYKAGGDGIITGADGYDVDAKILKGDKISVAADFDGTLTDGALGNLTFKAYACQAEGFTSPEEAYNACFTATP